MRWLCSLWLTPIALTIWAACSTDRPDCGCVVQQGVERRSVACGQSACIAGRLESCTETAEIIERGACSTGAVPSGEPDAGTTPAMPSDPNSGACLQLTSFCSTSCNSPAATAADCQATASAGNDDACQQWSLASAVLCRP